MQKQNYQDMRNYLKNENLKCCLQFVVYIFEIFTTEFTLMMQREEPLIQVLHPQLKKLIMILMSSIIKQSVLSKLAIDDIDVNSFFKTLQISLI